MSIFLAVFLLVSNLGLSFNIQYCGDSIASIVVDAPAQIQNASESCCKMTTDTKGKCCSNKTIVVEKKGDVSYVQTFSASVIFPFLVPVKSVFVFKSNFTAIKSVVSSYCNTAHAPPLFKLYQQYIFYA